MKNFNPKNLYKLASKILFFGFFGAGITPIKTCFAQSKITPDNTLGAQASKVIPNVNNLDGVPSELIEGGAQRGQNLFHSLQQFNVSEGRGAYFVVPNNTIQNVLTRVTGNNPSSVNGILGTISNRNFDPSNVNLFLINPNGIIFDRNASLDVNGSFVGTTANAVEFGVQGLFSATNPQSPSGLLTVNPSAFLFNQINAQASIQSTSVTAAGEDLSGNTLKGLRVGDGNSLLLLGGNLSIDGGGEGGGISAIGGRVELGGLVGVGTVELNQDGNNLSLNFPSDAARGNVFLSNRAGVRVIADNGGSIAVNAENLDMTAGSFLVAGIDRGVGSDNSKAGNLDVNVTREIKLNNESFIANQVQSETKGEGGDVNISASTLQLENGAQVSAATFSEGNGGSLTVNAQDIQLIGTSQRGRKFPSALFASAQPNSKGDAGDLNIKTNNLEIKDGAAVSTVTFGEGIAGNINIKVKDNFNADNGQIITQAERSSGGDINITTGKNIILRNNSNIRTTLSTTEGSGGNISLNANAIVALEDSDILTFAPEGRGGSINFNTNAFLSDSLFEAAPQTASPLTEEELNQLDGNDRVDVNATGSLSSGNISGQTDASFLQGDLTELPENPIDSEALVASSCVVRSKERKGSFLIATQQGLPHRPGDAVSSRYSAVKVQSLPDDTSITKPHRPWKIGDRIVEPTGVYRLANGRRILSRECDK